MQAGLGLRRLRCRAHLLRKAQGLKKGGAGAMAQKPRSNASLPSTASSPTGIPRKKGC